MRATFGLIALIATLATTASAGTASALERRSDDRARYLEQENHQRRERQIREHRAQEHGWWIDR